jgi:hypothetical protein
MLARPNFHRGSPSARLVSLREFATAARLRLAWFRFAKFAAPAALALASAAAVVSAGCPGKKSGEAAPIDSSAVPASGKLAKPRAPSEPSAVASAAAPSEDAQFPKAALFELYRADVLGSETERHAVLAKHGLEDSARKPVAPRVAAYEAALKKFASERADEWSAFAEEIERARAAAASRSPSGGEPR